MNFEQELRLEAMKIAAKTFPSDQHVSVYELTRRAREVLEWIEDGD